MAKLKSGILGGISGAVGNIVGFRRSGKDFIRTKPVHKRDSNTPAQQAQRLRFRLMITFLKKVNSFIKTGFKQAGGRTPMNIAMSLNVRQAIKGSFPDFEIDPENLVLAAGSLYGTGEFGLDLSVQGTATINWKSDTSTASAAESDIVLILLYNALKDEVAYTLNGGVRSDEAASLPIPATWSGDGIAGYLVFRSADGREVSNSIYLGTETAG